MDKGSNYFNDHGSCSMNYSCLESKYKRLMNQKKICWIPEIRRGKRDLASSNLSMKSPLQVHAFLEALIPSLRCLL